MQTFLLPVGPASLPVTLVPSTRRKTIALRITREQRVDVLVPAGTSFEEILPFLLEKTPWLRRKLAELAARPSPAPRLYASGDSFLYLGHPRRLCVMPQAIRRTRVCLDDDRLLVAVPRGSDGPELADAVRHALEVWYKQEAHTLLAAQAALYAPLLGVRPRRLALKRQQTRWGSCSTATGSINLNWLLVMAPLSVIDYVLVHELAHLLVPNHSNRFWKTVESILPAYREHRRWLKKNGHLLSL